MAQLQNIQLSDRGLQKMHDNKCLSDVIVQCEDRIFNAHKAVLALESDIFVRKFGKWDTPERSIDLTDESTLIVEAMLEYMYGHDYNISAKDSGKRGSKVVFPAMIFHARVYALAVKYAIVKLQELAAAKFKHAALNHWIRDDFLLVIKELFTSTYEPGQSLRKIAVDIACSRIDGLMDNETFDSLLKSSHEFAYDMVVGLRFQHRCNGCKKEVSVKLEAPYSGRCSSCGRYEKDWNNHKLIK